MTDVNDANKANGATDTNEANDVSEANAVTDAYYEKMTTWPVSKLVITLGIPTTISMLVTNIYNMADTYFVGELGNSASGAVGVVFGLMAIIQAVGFMLGQGGGSIIARRLGEKDVKSAGILASLSFFASLAAGTVMGLLGLLFLEPLMYLLGSTDTVLPYAKDYGIFILAVMPFTMSGFVLNNILRYEGKAYLAMIGLTVGGVLNIIGDPIFIFHFNMGVKGAGLSTAISQCISFLILLSMFLFGKTQSKLSLSAVKGGMAQLLLIMKTGLPSLARQGMTSLSTMVLNSLAGNYGDPALAAMSIVGKISFFIFAVALGIGQGFQPVSAFNYGAGKYKRVRKAFYFTAVMGEILLGTLAIAGLVCSGRLIGIFRDDVDVIEIGTLALRFQLVALFFHPMIVCATMLFQTIGRHKTATFLSILRSGLCFIPLIIVLTSWLGLLGIQLAQAVADVITFAVVVPFVVHFFKTLPEDV